MFSTPSKPLPQAGFGVLRKSLANGIHWDSTPSFEVQGWQRNGRHIEVVDGEPTWVEPRPFDCIESVPDFYTRFPLRPPNAGETLVARGPDQLVWTTPTPPPAPPKELPSGGKCGQVLTIDSSGKPSWCWPVSCTHVCPGPQASTPTRLMTPPGPYENDQAACRNGLKLGDQYYQYDGTVVVVMAQFT